MGEPWFGIYLPQLRMSFDRILERTLAAEAAGFDSVWLMDHFTAPAAPEVDTFEGWTIASALAARTSTIRIGHLVLCDPFRHPALLAKMAATLDVISGGRLDLGIGWGSVPVELETYGFGPEPPAVRAAKLRETLEILELMFAGETFDYAGTHNTLRRAIGRPVPAQPRVPIHIGGGGPKLTMPLVAQFADWWNCPGYALDRIDELRPLAGTARISTQHPIGLAADASERDDVIETAHRRYGSWGGVIAGTAGEVADSLGAEVNRGVEGFVLQFSDFGTPETAHRFMSEVAPAVARAGVTSKRRQRPRKGSAHGHADGCRVGDDHRSQRRRDRGVLRATDIGRPAPGRGGHPPHARLRPIVEGDRAHVRGVRLLDTVPEPASPLRARRQGDRSRGGRDRGRPRARRPVHRRRARRGRLPARAPVGERQGRRDRILLRWPPVVCGRVQSRHRRRGRLLRRPRRRVAGRPHARAADPADRPDPDLRCPLLGLFGAEDGNPSPEQTAQIEAALRANGKTYEFHTFENAGHAFFSVDRPNYRVDAAREGWKLVWDFFGRYLRD